MTQKKEKAIDQPIDNKKDIHKKIFNFNTVLYALAILGIIGGVAMIVYDLRPKPVAQPIMAPSFAPYQSFIAGSGIVEADSRNITVGSIVDGVIEEVLVKVGDSVTKGQPLFTLDKRQAMADLQIKLANVEVSNRQLDKAKASLKNVKDLFKLVQNLKDTRAISMQEFITSRNNVELAQADLKTAEANLVCAMANLEQSKTNLDLLTVRSAIDGEVLQVNADVGQHVTGGQTDSAAGGSNPSIMLGTVKRYNIRVDIDETDAWRFKPNTEAIAYLRGNTALKVPLKFEYYEPYVIPKQNLTGESTERVDVRVLQVLYSYDPKDLPSYLGQQVDVYIEVPA